MLKLLGLALFQIWGSNNQKWDKHLNAYKKKKLKKKRNTDDVILWKNKNEYPSWADVSFQSIFIIIQYYSVRTDQTAGGL